MMMGMMPMGGMAPKPKKAKKPKAEDEESTRNLEARDLSEQGELFAFSGHALTLIADSPTSPQSSRVRVLVPLLLITLHVGTEECPWEDSLFQESLHFDPSTMNQRKRHHTLKQL